MSIKRIVDAVLVTSLMFYMSSCRRVINTVQDSSFDKYGLCLDSAKAVFSAQSSSALHFYVEVSGSMNGFFRSNQANKFKKDVWSIVSNFGNPDIFVFSNEGTVADTSCEEFRNKMNRGGFVSNQETLVPTMLFLLL